MSNQELKQKLRAIVAEVAELDDVPDATPFKDLGIDSMMAIEIIADVERTYKIRDPRVGARADHRPRVGGRSGRIQARGRQLQSELAIRDRITTLI